jgi:hypothetical protein
MNEEDKALIRHTTIARDIAGEIKALDTAAHEIRSRGEYNLATDWLRDVVAEIETKVAALDQGLAACEALDVATAEDYKKAGSWLHAAKEREAQFQEFRERFTGPSYRLHKLMTSVFKPLQEKPKLAIDILNSKMNAYDREQERLRREHEAELRRLAEEEAAKERAEAEERARTVEASDPDLAEEIRDEAVSMPLLRPIVAPHKPPETEGLTPAKTWKAEVVDIDAFVAGVLSGGIPVEYAKITPNLEVLRGIAKSTNGKKQVAGIKFEHDTTRRKR